MSDYPAHPQHPPAFQQPTETSSLAILSLVTGIGAWVILPVIGAIIAIVTGHLARREVRNSLGRLTGNGLATAGLVLGYSQLAVSLCALCALFLWLARLSNLSSSSLRSLLLGLLALLW